MTSHEFFVGQIRCVVVPNGNEKATIQELKDIFPPNPEIYAALDTLTEPIDFSQNCLLIETDGQLILIDTGLGTVNPDYTSLLLPNLAEVGVSPEQINIVVLTHGHGDHIGGVVDDAGNLTFPNAQHIMSRVDWEHWTGPALRPISERCLYPLKETVKLIEMNSEIAAGVRSLAAPGHTPGHIAIVVESDGEKLIHLVDAAHHAPQVEHPTWSPKFDTDPILSAQTRAALFQQAAAENFRIMAYHFGTPGIGRVVAEGDTLRFVPE